MATRSARGIHGPVGLHVGRSRPRTGLAITVLGLAALVSAACTTAPAAGTGPSPEPGPPAIHAFRASTYSAPAPLTTAFTWSIPVPESTFTCSLDLDDDGTFEVTVPQCNSTSARSATFTEPGIHPVRLRVTDGENTVTSQPINLVVAEPSTDTYGVEMRFGPGVNPSQQAAFASAATRISEVVRTGQPDVGLVFPADQCLAGIDAFSGTVDDVLVDAIVEPIDGAGGVLASAGPCYTRSSNGLTTHGVIKFDSADVPGLESSGLLEDVILHEMVHVLGFGVFWGPSLLVGDDTSDPRYVGAVARGVWNQMAGPTATVVPVEATGGPGTAYSHWRETELENELMTGFINNGSNPLSAVSIGALADLGYGVDLAGADPYTPPGGFFAALRSPVGGTGIEVETELVTPVGTAD